MPPRGKESIIRRQKELARQQQQKEKQARRAERREKGGAGASSGELSPDDLISVEELTGIGGGGETPKPPAED